jgi:hypothetical protein
MCPSVTAALWHRVGELTPADGKKAIPFPGSRSQTLTALRLRWRGQLTSIADNRGQTSATVPQQRSVEIPR